MKDFGEKAKFHKPGVIYFGDHIYSDLAEPTLRLGWHTAAIVPELAGEVRLQNTKAYQKAVIWLQILTSLIEEYQLYSTKPQCNDIIREWANERKEIRYLFKIL